MIQPSKLILDSDEGREWYASYLESQGFHSAGILALHAGRLGDRARRRVSRLRRASTSVYEGCLRKTLRIRTKDLWGRIAKDGQWSSAGEIGILILERYIRAYHRHVSTLSLLPS